MPYALPREVLKNPADSRELPSRLPRPENAKFMPSNQIDFTKRKGSENDFLETGDTYFSRFRSSFWAQKSRSEAKIKGDRRNNRESKKISDGNTNYRLLCILKLYHQ